MPTVSISQIPGVAEPLRAYLWELTFVRTPAGVYIPEGLKLRAVSSRIPGRTFERIELHYLWMTWAVHGREAGDKEIEFEFWEGVDMAVRNAFMRWLELVGSWASGEQAYKADVSGDIQMKLLDGRGVPVRTIVLRNAMLIGLDSRDLRYDSNEVVSFTARFWYDWFDEM
jgi:hypothetical protein